jgi:crotonobetainyl-CoA:carnitine CoA-transferase CaiB-like acyl-CoA transferase
LTGYADGPPVELRHAMDHTGGMLAAFSAVAALLARSQTQANGASTNSHVDVSVRDLATAFIGPALLDYAMNGREVHRQGNRDSGSAPQGVYRCRGEDAWVSISVGSDSEWQGLVRAMGQPGWARDVKFGDGYQRWLNHDELDRCLEEWTTELTPWEITRALQQEGVPAFPSLSASQLAEDPHLSSRNTFPTVNHPEKGSQRAVAPPWRFSRSAASVDQWTPDLGEHNVEVFHGLLGLDRQEVADLEKAKVIW